MFEVYVAIVSGVVGSGGLLGIIKMIDRKRAREKRERDATSEADRGKVIMLQEEQNRHFESLLASYKAMIAEFQVRIIALEAQESKCQERLRAAEICIQDLTDAVARGNTPRLVAVIESDGGGTITGWNSAAQILFGWLPGEALGKSINLLTPPRIRALHEASFRKCVDEKRMPQTVAPFASFGLNKSGEEVPINVLPTAWHDGDNWTYAVEIRLR